MKREIKSFLFFSALLYAGTTHSYDPLTHRDLSVAAIESSVVEIDPTVLANLGLEPLSQRQRFSINGFDRKTIIQQIRDGSRVEDNGLRAVNHFFDPLNDRRLFGLNHRSPDWALEDRQDIDDQFSSLKDARENFYIVLTASSNEKRERRFGLALPRVRPRLLRAFS